MPIDKGKLVLQQMPTDKHKRDELKKLQTSSFKDGEQ